MNPNKIKSGLAAVLAAAMLVSAVGCSDDSGKGTSAKNDGNKETASAVQESGSGSGGSNGSGSSESGSEGELIGFSKYTNFEEYEPETHLDAKEIYANLVYSPQMFYGDYVNEAAIDEGEAYASWNTEAYTKSAKEYSTAKIKNDKGNEYEIVDVPFGFKAGRNNFYGNTAMEKIEKYNWMSMNFPVVKSDGSYSYVNLDGAYYIEGNKLVFSYFTTYEVDKDNDNALDYKFTDTPLEFEFEFSGGRVTLKNGSDSVTLTAEDFSPKLTSTSVTGYCLSQDTIEDIISFGLSRREPDEYTAILGDDMSIFNYMNVNTKRDDGYYDSHPNVVGHFYDDGIVKFSWADGDGTPHAYEFVYFCCGSDGLVLTDGEKKYYYNGSYSDYMLGRSVATTDDEKLENLNEDKVAAIAEKKKSLQDELMAAFEKEGISVECNEDTGEMMLDSSVLFEVDQYELSSSGEEFLNKFMKAYSSVILKDDYEGFVSKIMVEGHTDSTGERAHNEELSKNRAEEVLNYCVSDKTKIDSKVRSEMKSLMEAVGYADDYPILDEGGKEDMEKSRRVSFKFVIDMDNAEKLEAPKKVDEEAEAKKAAEEKEKEEEEALEKANEEKLK